MKTKIKNLIDLYLSGEGYNCSDNTIHFGKCLHFSIIAEETYKIINNYVKLHKDAKGYLLSTMSHAIEDHFMTEFNKYKWVELQFNINRTMYSNDIIRISLVYYDFIMNDILSKTTCDLIGFNDINSFDITTETYNRVRKKALNEFEMYSKYDINDNGDWIYTMADKFDSGNLLII